MKQLLKTFLKQKFAALIALAGAFLISYSQKMLAPSQETVTSNPETISQSADSSAMASDQTNSLYSGMPDTSCAIYPATAEVTAESDFFADKASQLQSGFTDTSAANPYVACAQSEAGRKARTTLPTVATARDACRNNHQKQVEALQASKSQYYERYLALSKEPACSGLLSAVENQKAAITEQAVALQTSADGPFSNTDVSVYATGAQ